MHTMQRSAHAFLVKMCLCFGLTLFGYVSVVQLVHVITKLNFIVKLCLDLWDSTSTTDKKVINFNIPHLMSNNKMDSIFFSHHFFSTLHLSPSFASRFLYLSIYTTVFNIFDSYEYACSKPNTLVSITTNIFNNMKTILYFKMQPP